jgi:hypothetical protein
MATFVNLHKLIARNAFLAFPSAQNEVTSGKGFGVLKKFLNRFSFQTRDHQGKGSCGEK